MNCLRPLITHWSPFSTARVGIAASGALYGSQRAEAPRHVPEQHRDLPDLHQLVGKPRVAARDLLGDEGESLHLVRRIKRNAAEFLGHAESADSDLDGLLEDGARQARIRVHQPLTLPVLADERRDEIVDECAAATAHQALLFG